MTSKLDIINFEIKQAAVRLNDAGILSDAITKHILTGARPSVDKLDGLPSQYDPIFLILFANGGSAQRRIIRDGGLDVDQINELNLTSDAIGWLKTMPAYNSFRQPAGTGLWIVCLKRLAGDGEYGPAKEEKPAAVKSEALPDDPEDPSETEETPEMKKAEEFVKKVSRRKKKVEGEQGSDPIKPVDSAPAAVSTAPTAEHKDFFGDNELPKLPYD